MTRSFISIDEPGDVDVVRAHDVEPKAARILVPSDGGVVEILVALDLLAVLSDRASKVLDELEASGIAAISSAVGVDLVARLDPSSNTVFPAQTVLVGWDDEIDRVVIEAWSPMEDGGVGETGYDVGVEDDVRDDDPDGPDVVRVRLTPPVAARFVQRASATLTTPAPPD